MPDETTAAPAADTGVPERAPQFIEPDYAELVTDSPLETQEATDAPAEPQAPPASTQQAPAVPASPMPVSQAEPVAPTAPVAAESVPTTPAPVAPPESAQPTAPAQPAMSKEQLEETLRKVDEALLQKYSFDSAEAEKLDKLEARPSEYLPRLLAKVHREAYVNAVEAAAARIPEMIQQTLEQQRVATEAETQFFSRWPELRENPKEVVEAIQAFKAINPAADLQTTIERAGALAMVNLGRSIASRPAGTSAPSQPAAAPFRPAMPGAAGQPAGQPAGSYEERVYSQMVEEMLKGDF